MVVANHVAEDLMETAVKLSTPDNEALIVALKAILIQLGDLTDTLHRLRIDHMR